MHPFKIIQNTKYFQHSPILLAACSLLCSSNCNLKAKHYWETCGKLREVQLLWKLETRGCIRFCAWHSFWQLASLRFFLLVLVVTSGFWGCPHILVEDLLYFTLWSLVIVGVVSYITHLLDSSFEVGGQLLPYMDRTGLETLNVTVDLLHCCTQMAIRFFSFHLTIV